MRWIAANYLFSPPSQFSYKTESSPIDVYWVNFGNHMRWFFVRNAMNFTVSFLRNAVKCGELYFFTAFTAFTSFLTKIHRISYKNLPKSLDPGGRSKYAQKFFVHVKNYMHPLDLRAFRRLTFKYLWPQTHLCTDYKNVSSKIVSLLCAFITVYITSCLRS